MDEETENAFIDRITSNPRFATRIVENDYFMQKMQERMDRDSYARFFRKLIRAIVLIATIFSPKIADWLSSHIQFHEIWKD